LLGVEFGVRSDTKEFEVLEFWGSGIVLYLDLVITPLYVYDNTQNCTLKRVILQYIHYTSVKEKFKKFQRVWGKKNPHTLLVGMQASATTLENNMEAS
jgi:hypothetical protein